eukprot:TRINITY_DN20371_c0_g1_i1.p1 TRINITY_DN20371_c0_g1~~TRINITY_DN20371_c0_g1_i1.p1  ORF type:complete len:140 (+),score=39.87 TRINITY_DN20371_c0_g1_i1:171-590(+)
MNFIQRLNNKSQKTEMKKVIQREKKSGGKEVKLIKVGREECERFGWKEEELSKYLKGANTVKVKKHQEEVAVESFGWAPDELDRYLGEMKEKRNKPQKLDLQACTKCLCDLSAKEGPETSESTKLLCKCKKTLSQETPL